MIRMLYLTKATTVIVALAFAVVAAGAPKPDDEDNNGDDNRGSSGCASLPTYTALKAALVTATATDTSGLKNQMWASIVDRDGIVCAVAFTGINRGAQWAGSRVISAQKANTCGPQEFRRALSDLLFQPIIVMQSTEDRLESDAVTDGKLMPMAACRNTRLDWFRCARP